MSSSTAENVLPVVRAWAKDFEPEKTEVGPSRAAKQDRG